MLRMGRSLSLLRRAKVSPLTAGRQIPPGMKAEAPNPELKAVRGNLKAAVLNLTQVRYSLRLARDEHYFYFMG